MILGNTVGLGGDGVTVVGGPNSAFTMMGTGGTIGGTAPGWSNTVRGNSCGVGVSGQHIRISGNSISTNSCLGIDLGVDGVTSNDGTVSATKPNNGMDFPVFTLSAYNAVTGKLTLQGHVGSAPGQTVFGGAQVELFKSDGNASGYGSGAVYLGTIAADANGKFDTAIVIPTGLLAVGDKLTATATDALGNTSEFSGNTSVADESSLKPARFNAFETDTPAAAITGVIRSKVAGAAATLAVIATNSAGTGLHGGFTGNVTLDWLDARDDSGAPDTGACRSSWVSLGAAGTVAFNNNARNNLSLTPPATGTRAMRLRMSSSANGITTVSCSTDAFAALPASLVLDGALDADATTTGTARKLDNTSASGGVVHNAGQPFTVQARALTATGAVMSGYDGTPELGVATCVLPSGCTPGALTAPATAAVAGVYSNTAVSYAEVGAIALQLQDLNYAAVDVADTAAASRELRSVRVGVGRFVPDNYLLSVAKPGVLHTANASCTLAGAGYSFIGQGVGWATAPTIQVTARNAAGNTTTLWTGALMKLLPAHGTPKMSVSGAGAATLASTHGALAVADLGAGQASITAANDDLFTLGAAAPQASVTPTFAWALQVTDTSEAGVAGNPTLAGSISNKPIGFDLGGLYHSGRLALAGGHGDARIGVRMLVQLQRYTGTGWQTINEDRGCVSVAPRNLGYSEPLGVFTTAGLCAAPSTAAATTAGGRAWLSLPATPGGQSGQLTVQLLAGSGAANSCAAANSPSAGQSMGLAYLLGGQTAPGPTAHANWGLTNRDLLYRRERY
jgi:hypothetical protein